MIDTGLELTRTGGADAVILREAARRVGVSPNATYRHFADRDALLAAVVVRVQDDVAQRMRSLAASLPSGMSVERAILRAVGLGYIGFALAEPGWFDAAFGSIEATPDGAASLPPALALLVEALDALAAKGELTPEARDGAEWPCWSAWHGFAMLALHGPLHTLPRATVRAHAERTVDAVITGVLAG